MTLALKMRPIKCVFLLIAFSIAGGDDPENLDLANELFLSERYGNTYDDGSYEDAETVRK